MLLQSLDGLLKAIAQRAASLTPKQQKQLQQLLIAIGVFDLERMRWNKVALRSRELEALWRFWTPLAVIFEGQKLMTGDAGAMFRARPYLGEQWWSNVDDHHQTTLHLKVVERNDWPENPPDSSLDAMPLGLFDLDNWIRINWTWAKPLSQNTEQAQMIGDWLQTHTPTLQHFLNRLMREVPISSEAYKRLETRRPQQPSPRVRALPYAIGAITLAQRSIARSTRFWHNHDRRQLRQWALRAFEITEELYTRDLCLFELSFIEAELTHHEHISSSSHYHRADS
jgi:hypothetical protein